MAGPRYYLASLIAPYRDLGGSLWSMFLATIVNRFGDFIGPFLALYLTKRMGYGEARAGLIVSLSFGASALGVLVSGRVADAVGRKATLIACHSAAALCALAMSFLYELSWSPVLVAAGCFFRGSARPLISALISDLAPSERRKEAFALQYWSINVGVAVGPLVAAYLFDRDISWLFRGDGLCSMLSAALILVGVRPPRRSRAGSSLEREDSRGSLAAFFARPILPCFCVLAALSAFTYSQTLFALPLTLAERLGEAGPRAFGSIMSLNATIVIVLSIPIARLMRSRPPLWCMAMAAGAFVLGFSMLALPFGIAWIAASTLVWTVGEIIQSVNVGVFVPSRSPANWRASFQSFSASCTQAGHSLGPLAAGPVIAALGSGGLWALAAAACALWGLGAMALNRREARDRD